VAVGRGAARPRTGGSRAARRLRLPGSVTLCLRVSATGSQGLMSAPGVEQLAVVVAREQVDVARRELTARAREAGPGVAMVGGGGLLAALASGTGTAALILLLARRPGAAAALGVTGAYAGAGAILARKGFMRLREAAPSLADVPVQDEPVQNAKQELGSAKRRTKSAAKSPRRTKSTAKSPPHPTGRPKPKSKSPSSRARATRAQTDRARRRAS
jgi:Putative Actinobacterial Holin-X, holin superfamily III